MQSYFHLLKDDITLTLHRYYIHFSLLNKHITYVLHFILVLIINALCVL